MQHAVGARASQARQAQSKEFVSTVELNTGKNLNYKLLLEKVKCLLSKPSNFFAKAGGYIFIKY